MKICTCKFKDYLLKSRIGLQEKINTKPHFDFNDDCLDRSTVKVNYILDAQNNRKNYFVIDIT